MARAKQTEAIEKASSLDTPDRFRLGEIGYNAVRLFNGVSNEELKKELNHPNAIKTYRQMSLHPSINSALNLYNCMISKAKFRVMPPKDYTEDEKKKAEIVTQMLDDMEHSMDDFISEVMTMSVHGFSVIEKVYRRRTKAAGSMYDDGLIAPRKLKLRSQESIEKFIMSDDGNDVLGVKQNISWLHDPYGFHAKRLENEVILPRSKFMLFNIGRNRSNPYGTSPLRDVYLPWKYLQAIEELEATGVSKDLQGIPLLRLPAQYMSADASPDQKIVYENFKNIVRNLQQGSQAGVILPSAVDPETRKELFDLQLLSSEGKKSFDTAAIKDYYRTMIFIGLSADILLMGNTQTGSFALGSLKNSITGNAIENYLRRIVQVLNDDLIRQIYELNSWDVTRRCKVDYEGFEETDLDDFSRAIQRMGAVGFLPKTHDVVNRVLGALGVDPLDDDADLDELLGDNESRVGDGMKEGLGSGTGKAVSSDDSSVSNKENA
jgi:hypothetical protein